MQSVIEADAFQWMQRTKPVVLAQRKERRPAPGLVPHLRELAPQILAAAQPRAVWPQALLPAAGHAHAALAVPAVPPAPALRGTPCASVLAASQFAHAAEPAVPLPAVHEVPRAVPVPPQPAAVP
eukprot:scaffold30176_cov19-Tisochrysis_lutea.AAC.1